MKRVMSLVIASALVLALTGCQSNTTSDDSGTSSSAPETSSVVSESSSSTSEETSSTPEDTGESGDTSEPAGEDEPGENDLSWLPDTRAGAYAKAALSSGTWGAMELIPEEAFEFVIADFDTTWASEFVFANTLISANLYKVYVIKPAEGCDDQVKDWLDSYLAYCRESAAFYPQQVTQAEAAVVGVTNDGYRYLICNEEGASIAEYMTANV